VRNMPGLHVAHKLNMCVHHHLTKQLAEEHQHMEKKKSW
jgi:hypothetical protein